MSDNEINRWKINAKTKPKKTKKKKKNKERGGTEAILKGWGLNDFVVHLA